MHGSGSDSECESLDSGLETGGNSNLEPSEAGFVEVGTVSEDSEADEKRPDSGASAESHLSDFSEGIYENAAVLKSSNMSSPVTTALEKYEFGQHEILDEDSDQFPGEKRTQSEVTEETGNSDNEAVSFQDIENFESGPVKKSWGVRHDMGTSLARVERSANPTEEIIAKEIRELKEREEELTRLREQGSTEEQVEEPETEEAEEPIVEPEPPAKSISTNNFRLNEPKPINNNNSKFNPSLYGPSILSSKGKAGIMQNFLNNKGKVNAFKSPDRDTIVTLRKPQVYKSVPKVSPPVSSSGLRQTGNVLDKIQAELAETKRREDELRRQRRSVTKSQPDLSNLDTRETEAEPRDQEEVESGDEEEEETPSLVCTRGKSALISVWENRIQCEKAA